MFLAAALAKEPLGALALAVALAAFGYFLPLPASMLSVEAIEVQAEFFDVFFLE